MSEELVMVDASRLNSRFTELYDALIGAGQTGDAATVFEDEARKFLEGTIRITPPKNKKQGENAILKDMRNVFTPVNEDFLNVVGSEHGVSNIDAWITTAGGQKKHLLWDKIDPSGEGMQQHHFSNRNSRGRTRNLQNRNTVENWYSPYVVSYQDFKDYAARVATAVGKRKGAWFVSLKSVGGQVASWIANHGGLRGAVSNQLRGQNPSIMMSNFAPGILDDTRVVKAQLRIRYGAIGRRIKGIISGYSKDWKRGVKIAKQARKTSPEFVS